MNPLLCCPSHEGCDEAVLLQLPQALERLRHWARVSPLHPALRHKRQGRWWVWRWIDVLRDVQRLADGLRQRELTADSRLLLSGDIEPSMLLLALGARSIGAQVLSLGPVFSPKALQRNLWRWRPSHGFVCGPAQRASWHSLAEPVVAPRWLIGNQAIRPEQVGARGRTLTFYQLLGASDAPHSEGYWPGTARADELWNEARGPWPGGLQRLLQQWLDSGQGLAFIEPACGTETAGSGAIEAGALVLWSRWMKLARLGRL